jgi:hypothetical protein
MGLVQQLDAVRVNPASSAVVDENQKFPAGPREDFELRARPKLADLIGRLVLRNGSKRCEDRHAVIRIDSTA